MKQIATIVNFCNGKRLRDVANPLTSKLPRVWNTLTGNKLTAAWSEGEAFAGRGKALPEISDYHEPARTTGAGLDSNMMYHQERNGC